MTNVAIQDSDYKADILSWWFYFQKFSGKLTVHIKALSIKINLPIVDCGVMQVNSECHTNAHFDSFILSYYIVFTIYTQSEAFVHGLQTMNYCIVVRVFFRCMDLWFWTSCRWSCSTNIITFFLVFVNTQHAKLNCFGGLLECDTKDFYDITIFYCYIVRHMPTPIGCFSINQSINPPQINKNSQLHSPAQ
jgi:hypothetical protein